MGLFRFSYDRPGPGVAANAPRKKGLARFFEMLSRDFGSFWLAGMLALLSAVPYIFGLWFSISTHSVIPLLFTGIVGGMLMAPQLVGLNDTILRSLRDEPGYWWATYRRSWKRNAKASLLPGALFGTLLGAQIFTLFHYDWSQSPVLAIIMLVGIFFLLGLAEYIFAQVALLELGFGGILRNALFLFLGYLPRTAMGILWVLLYAAVIALFFPVTLALVLLTGLWFPVQCALQAIYPVLDKSFELETTIKAMRDAQLNGESDGADK